MALVAEDPDVAPAAVVAREQASVDHHPGTESRAERHAQQVAVALRGARPGKQGIHLGKRSTDRLPVGKEVAVVVDVDRNPEAALEVGAQGHASAEGGEVRKIPDDAVGIVRRPGECETDRHGRGVKLPHHGTEAFDKGRKHAVEVVRRGVKMDGLNDFAVSRDSREDEVRASGVERKDGAGIVFQHIGRIFSDGHRP